MKNKKLVLYSGILSASCLFNVYGMNPLVRQEINKIEEKFNKDTDFLSLDACMLLGLTDWRREQFAKVVSDFGELMTDTEKLEYLLGGSFFERRKKIIDQMINEKKIHPNNIVYQKGNPLLDAATNRRVDFAKYLLEKGAKPDKETLQMVDLLGLSDFKELFTEESRK
jgi:hypothetical protein